MDTETPTKAATTEDLYRVMGAEGTYELVDGMLVQMAPVDAILAVRTWITRPA